MKKSYLFLAASFACALSTSAAETQIISRWNPDNVIVPATQYTNEQWEADIWLVNGPEYGSPWSTDNPRYNVIVGTPAKDANGKNWYEPDYTLTPGTSGGQEINWERHRSPFSSDASYHNMESYQWGTNTTADIYIRRTFNLDEVPPQDIFLACQHDDAPTEYYINGVEVLKITDGWQAPYTYLLTEEQKALLHTGENTLAFHVHQNWGGALADGGLYYTDMTEEYAVMANRTGGPWECMYMFGEGNGEFEFMDTEGWEKPEYDDTEFFEPANGPFGDVKCEWKETEWDGTLYSLFVRRHFTLTADDMKLLTDGKHRMVLNCFYDEYPKAYLNGEKIWEAEYWTTDNDPVNYARHTLTEEQMALLHEGDNVFAISLQSGGGGSAVDCGFNIVRDYVPGGAGVAAPEADAIAKPHDNRIFNLFGQYMGTDASRLNSGIYVIGGKKTVIRK
jgi:hypothetical protein